MHAMTTLSGEKPLSDNHLQNEKDILSACPRSFTDVALANLPDVLAPQVMTRSMSGSKTVDLQTVDSRQLSEQLIEKATIRLRRRMLEEGMSAMMHEIIQLQSQLEFMRVDVAATMDAVDKLQDGQLCHLESLERRLRTHQAQLEQFKVTSPSSRDDAESTTSKLSGAPTCPKSRLSSFSRFSSLFSCSSNTSSAATSVSGQDCDDAASTTTTPSTLSSGCADLLTEDEQQRRSRRRKRVKQLVQKHQERMGTKDPYLTELKWQTATKDSSIQESTRNDISLVEFTAPKCYTCMPDSSVPQPSAHIKTAMLENDSVYQDESLDLHSMCSTSSSSVLSSPRGFRDIPMLSRPLPTKLVRRHSLLPVSQASTEIDSCLSENNSDALSQKETFCNQSITWPSDCNLWSQSILRDHNLDRTVLDDTLSFLDSLSDNADDGGFGEDVDWLLRHPDLCCRPLSEIRDTMSKIRQQENQQMHEKLNLLQACLSPVAMTRYGTQLTSNVCASGWKWCKFLSILSAAVMVSVINGPDDALDN